MTQLVLDTSAFFRLAGGGNLDTLEKLGYKFWTTETVRREVEDSIQYKNAFDAKEWIDKHSGGALEVVNDVREFGELTGRDRGEISIENYIASKGAPKGDFKIIIEDKNGASRLARVVAQSNVVSVLDFYSRQVLEGKWSYGFALSEVNKAITYGHDFSAIGKTGFIAPTSVNPQGQNIFGSGAVGQSGSSEWKAGSSDYPVKVTGHQVGTIHFPGNLANPITYNLRGGRFTTPPNWGPAAIIEVKPDGNVIVRSKASAFKNRDGVIFFLGESIQTVTPDGQVWGETPGLPGKKQLNSIERPELDNGVRYAGFEGSSALEPSKEDDGADTFEGVQNAMPDVPRVVQNEPDIAEGGKNADLFGSEETDFTVETGTLDGLDSLRSKLKIGRNRTEQPDVVNRSGGRILDQTAFVADESRFAVNSKIFLSPFDLSGKFEHVGGVADLMAKTSRHDSNQGHQSITVHVSTPMERSEIDAAVKRILPTQANYQKEWNGSTLGSALIP